MEHFTTSNIESISTTAYGGLPFTPFVSLIAYMNDGVYDLLNDPYLQRPHSLQGFRFERQDSSATKLGSAYNTFSITIFDETGINASIILSYLLSKPVCVLQFGYVNGSRSPEYLSALIDVRRDFKPQGATLTITGNTYSYLNRCIRRTKTFKGKTISQIVEQICMDEGWEVGYIEPTKPIIVDGDHKIYYQSNIDSREFLASLAKEAISAKTGLGGYSFYFGDDIRGEWKGIFKSKLYFRPLSFDKVPIRKYSYYYTRDSQEVLSFNAKTDGYVGFVAGAFSTYLDEDGKAVRVNATKNSISIVAEQQKQMIQTVLSSKSNKAVPIADRKYLYPDGQMTYGGLPYVGQQRDVMEAQTKAFFDAQKRNAFSATAEIMGDPGIKVYDTLDFRIYNRYGKLDFTSGLYIVKKISDSIAGGKYTTTLELSRSQHPVGMLEAVGMPIGKNLNTFTKK